MTTADANLINELRANGLTVATVTHGDGSLRFATVSGHPRFDQGFDAAPEMNAHEFRRVATAFIRSLRGDVEVILNPCDRRRRVAGILA